MGSSARRPSHRQVTSSSHGLVDVEKTLPQPRSIANIRERFCSLLSHYHRGQCMRAVATPGSRNRASRRGKALELVTERVLGGERVHRSRFESAPDLEPLTLPCGLVVQIECKARAALPVLVVDALDQARKYAPEGALPVAVLRAKGAAPIVVLSLAHFALISGAQS